MGYVVAVSVIPVGVANGLAVYVPAAGDLDSLYPPAPDPPKLDPPPPATTR